MHLYECLNVSVHHLDALTPGIIISVLFSARHPLFQSALLCGTDRSQRANHSQLCLLSQQDAKTKTHPTVLIPCFHTSKFFTQAHKSRMTITNEKKNGVNRSILKAGVIAAIPQPPPQHTLFVLLRFGRGSVRSGRGKAEEIEHVLMSSVWALHHVSNRWTK